MRSWASRSSSQVVKAPQNPNLPTAGRFGDGNVGSTRQPHSRTIAAHPPQLDRIIWPLVPVLFEQLPGIERHEDKHQTR